MLKPSLELQLEFVPSEAIQGRVAIAFLCCFFTARRSTYREDFLSHDDADWSRNEFEGLFAFFRVLVARMIKIRSSPQKYLAPKRDKVS